MKKIIILIILYGASLIGSIAQEKQQITSEDYVNSEVEMADTFREEGKIYVLTGIILVIFAGLTVYLVTIDRKITAMEKEAGK